MERPASVSVIAALFFLVAGYLVAIGITDIVAPGTLSMTMRTGVTYGRELTGPQTAFSVGAGGHSLVGVFTGYEIGRAGARFFSW